MIKVLLIEDDRVLSDTVTEIVEELAEVTQVYDGDDGLFEAESGVYDLIILDVMLPQMDGQQLLKRLRQTQQTPVLMLTAKGSLNDKVQSFTLGADDYLTKPFYREELLLRVKALLRRSLGLYDENTLSFQGIHCHLQAKEVYFNNSLLPIQGKEFDLLTYLIQNQDIILTKEQIFDRIWGFDSATTLTVVEVYMSNLRKHLKPSGVDIHIKTLRNVGYMMKGVVE